MRINEDEDFSRYSFFDELFNGGDGDIDDSLMMKLGISIPDGFDKDVDGNNISYTFTAIKKADEIDGEIQLNKNNFEDKGATVNFWLYTKKGAISDLAYLDPDISILEFGKIVDKFFKSNSNLKESAKRKVLGRVSVREAKAFRQGYLKGLKEGNAVSKTNTYIVSALEKS